jgi:N-glycosylase/DNA lyase
MQAVISQAQTLAREGEGLPAEEAGRVIADAVISKRPRTRCTDKWGLFERYFSAQDVKNILKLLRGALRDVHAAES